MTLKFLKFTIKWSIRFLLLFVIGLAGVLITSYFMGPPEISANPITVFYDSDGNPIGDKTEQEHEVVLDDIASAAVDATLVIEDRHFREHHGFDFRGIARAIWRNLTSHDLKEGASTITQQYARNLYLSHEKTWLRKAKEAFYTIRLEMFYPKDTILAGYLNTIYYGHGAYGIEEASEFFFDKKAKDLNLAEAAMLAGIPKGPTYYSPFNDEERAFKRQDLILHQMLQHGFITQADYHKAKGTTLDFSDPDKYQETSAAFFRDTAMKETAELLNEEISEVRSSGYRVYTTLDNELQQATEENMEKHMPADSEIETGIMTLDPATGAVRSLIGGTDYEESAYNRATDAKRLVGSAFKPILYYAALENGFTPSTMLLSEPTSFDLPDGEAYEPTNYNGYYAYKPISLAQAIALSDNIFAVKTNLMLGPENVAQTARDKFGIESELPGVPSLALGSSSISLEEMTRAYGTVASGGKEVDGHTVTKIVDQSGKVVYTYSDEERQQVLNEQKAFLLTHLMTGMFDRRLNGYMDVTGSSIVDQLTQLYAGKSGTTDTDSWMIGFSPTAVTAVWTGYDDNTAIKKTNEKIIAKNIWAATIEKASNKEKETEFPVPDGIVKKLVDPETGQLAGDHCPVARTTYFEKGTEPTETCRLHKESANEEKDEPEGKPFWKRLLDMFE